MDARRALLLAVPLAGLALWLAFAPGRERAAAQPDAGVQGPSRAGPAELAGGSGVDAPAAERGVRTSHGATPAVAESVEPTLIVVEVRDDEMAPLAGARVTLHLLAGAESVPIGVGGSDPQGVARFGPGPLAGLPLAALDGLKVRVSTTAPGYEREVGTHGLHFYPQAGGLAELVVVMRGPPTVLPGRVVDAGGRPVVGALVQIVTTRPLPGIVQHERTDVEGLYEQHEDLGAGIARLSAWHADGTATLEFSPPFRGELGGELPELVLSPGLAIEGRVLLPDGSPARDAELVLRPASPQAFDLEALEHGEQDYFDIDVDGDFVPARPWPQRLRADGEGNFRAAGLVAGDWDLVGLLPGGRDWPFTPFEVAGVATRAAAGERGVEVVIDHALLVLRVRDPDGSPLPDATVECVRRVLHGPEGTDPRWSSFDSLRLTESRASGLDAVARFLLIPGERYAISADEGARNRAMFELRVPAKSGVIERTLTLWPEGAEGRVRFRIRGEDGAQLRAESVSLLEAFERSPVYDMGLDQLGPDGLLDGVPCGTWRAWVAHDLDEEVSPYLRGGLSDSFTVRPDGVTLVDAVAPLAGRIEVDLYAARGEDGREVEVLAQRLGPGGERVGEEYHVGTGVPGDRLRSVEPLVPGEWVVVSGAGDGVAGDSERVLVAPGTTAAVRLIARW